MGGLRWGSPAAVLEGPPPQRSPPQTPSVPWGGPAGGPPHRPWGAPSPSGPPPQPPRPRWGAPLGVPRSGPGGPAPPAVAPPNPLARGAVAGRAARGLGSAPTGGHP